QRVHLEGAAVPGEGPNGEGIHPSSPLVHQRVHLGGGAGHIFRPSAHFEGAATASWASLSPKRAEQIAEDPLIPEASWLAGLYGVLSDWARRQCCPEYPKLMRIRAKMFGKRRRPCLNRCSTVRI